MKSDDGTKEFESAHHYDRSVRIKILEKVRSQTK
jgi:hypothetical protein